MQNRMKNHPLRKDHIIELLKRAKVGNIATINKKGYPYVVPVHFVYYEDKIYIHGLPNGEKIDNIIENKKVGFETYDMQGLLIDELACDTNAQYESVVILGNAKIVDDETIKENILNKIVDKYTPIHSGGKLPKNMIKGTVIIEINILECTGKYYK